MRKFSLLILCGLLAPGAALAAQGDCTVDATSASDAQQNNCAASTLTNSAGENMLRADVTLQASSGVYLTAGSGTANNTLKNSVVLGAAHVGGTVGFGANTAQSSVSECSTTKCDPQQKGATSAAQNAWNASDST